MDDIKDYLAQTVMNFRKSRHTIYNDTDDILFGDPSDTEYWCDGDEIVMEVGLWNPLENVYQARSVLRKMVERGMIEEIERLREENGLLEESLSQFREDKEEFDNMRLSGLDLGRRNV